MRRLVLLLFMVLSCANSHATAPNIVFILVDDLGINDLTCYGRTEHHTPNLDRLAREGVRFTNAYSAAPVCSPTRAAIMSGKAPARLHLTTFLPGRPNTVAQKLLHPKINQQLPLDEVTLAEKLQARGYRTAAIGKWHLGGPNFAPTKQGFDQMYAGKANTTPSENEGGKGEYDLTKQAEELISQKSDKPFFLYLCHNTPHIPLAAKAELVKRYANAYNPVYAAIIHEMDVVIGRLLTKLDELKLRDNTIVIFTSDNGGVHIPELKEDPPTHCGIYRAGKGFVYEGGLRIPAIVRGPGIQPLGRTIETPIISHDWYPTLLTLAGGSVSNVDGLDGVDLAPLLRGGSIAERNLYWHSPHYMNQGSRPSGAMRSGSHKLVVHYEDQSHELYNLATDPSETNNLAKEQPKFAEMLRAKFETWLTSVNAQRNTQNREFRDAEYRKLYVDVDVSRLKAKATAAETAAELREWRKRMDTVQKLP